MIIYCARNKINGLRYIGQTRNPLEKRKAQHESDAVRNSPCYFHRALLHYGFGCFEWRVLWKADAQNELDSLEQDFIGAYNTVSPFGYNLTAGGERCEYSDTTKKKISDGLIRYWQSPASAKQRELAKRPKTESTRAKIARSHLGRSPSQEHRARLSAANTGKALTAAHKEKLSKSLRGRVVTPEHRAKLSAALKGRLPTKEARAKMSKTRRGNRPQNGKLVPV